MPSPTTTLQPPLSSVVVTPSVRNSWLKAQLSGVPTPGWIPARGGMKGFRRKSGFDKKKGKGSAGATLTLVTAPPVEGEVELHLFTEDDFADWDDFAQGVLSTPTAAQQKDGLPWYWPAHASIGLTTVVVEDYSPPESMGRGLYAVHIKLCEWFPPPALSIVKTVASTSPGASVANNNAPVKPIDPRIVAAQAQLAAAQAKRFDSGGGGSQF